MYAVSPIYQGVGMRCLPPRPKHIAKNFSGTTESLRHVPDAGVGTQWAQKETREDTVATASRKLQIEVSSTGVGCLKNPRRTTERREMFHHSTLVTVHISV